MIASRIIKIDGIFLGTLILDHTPPRHRFYAVHDSVRSLHKRTASEPGELMRQAALHLRRARYTAAYPS
ncbi:hypothetical protein [Acetobacter estunensis]|uniref:hypothetical protein n=1 Tax=Acetobacter estunensis TaxID=104097 RepID=UPI001C2CD8E2|nr:hypothetical protein [Acetobacter estunensis]MBV1836645.1 hypothetical protein [Acetobacter estunensis]